MGTVDEVSGIYDLARELLGERDKDYEGSWKDEGLDCMLGSLFRKASQLKVMLGNGRLKENKEKSKEDLLDCINYAVLSYVLLEGGG